MLPWEAGDAAEERRRCSHERMAVFLKNNGIAPEEIRRCSHCSHGRPAVLQKNNGVAPRVGRRCSRRTTALLLREAGGAPGKRRHCSHRRPALLPCESPPALLTADGTSRLSSGS